VSVQIVMSLQDHNSPYKYWFWDIFVRLALPQNQSSNITRYFYP